MNGDSNSLAFQLSSINYDVWLLNFRGNSYSRSHSILDPNTESEYWDFSIDELAIYDLPSAINHILSTTSHSNLTIIGYSLGTTVAFNLVSRKQEEWNNKINKIIQISPMITLNNVTNEYFNKMTKSELMVWFL
jgi:lysosomal acid lipase/cholesteryl ester hydrolase